MCLIAIFSNRQLEMIALRKRGGPECCAVEAKEYRSEVDGGGSPSKEHVEEESGCEDFKRTVVIGFEEQESLVCS